MRLITIKKPTYLNKKWTAKFEHQGKESVYEFNSSADAINFYISAKHKVGEFFN
jgi:hypothetical protein